jgi:hypothetical protein
MVQVKVRGNSWGLHHAYRQNGTIKHLLLGSVPEFIRKGRTAPQCPLDATKLVLDIHDYLVRNRKAGADRLRPFLFNGWPKTEPEIPAYVREWLRIVQDNAEWYRHFHMWSAVGTSTLDTITRNP